MAEQEVKFTEDEMKQISELQKTYVNIQNTLGQLSISRMRLEQQLEEMKKNEDGVKSQFTQTQTSEREFVESINKKYGDGNLDLNTGVFTPKKSEETTNKTL